MTNGKAEIIIAGNNPLITEGLYKIVGKMTDANSVRKVVSEEEIYMHLRRQHLYDVYILDIDHIDRHGLELIETVREETESAFIIASILYEEQEIIDKLIELQVNAVIHKSATPGEIETAIRQVVRNEIYCSPQFGYLRRKLQSGRKFRTHKDDLPTRRELEVLRSIATGNNTLKIADELGISENTVETFRKHLMLKFDARNAIDLVVKAISRGWININ
ncbi:MAG: response regulator transcription factor [Bacteroidales bacterium]|nr:response regulator transcription factor [Bacteroidales bacterium]